MTALPDLWSDTWSRLRRATVDRKHAFRWATLATPGPDARTVVLRAASPEALVCHSDARARKLRLSEGDEAAWCFFDRRALLQVRIRGPITAHRDGLEHHTAWSALSPRAKEAYGPDLAPGTPREDAVPVGHTADPQRFAVLVVRPRRVDVLRLGELHTRAVWTREGDAWSGTFVVP